MKQRGTLLRDTQAGTGLVIVAGQQHPFTLEGIWRSSEAPAVNMTVEAEFDAQGQLTALYAVPAAQLARERADEAVALLKTRGGAMASGVLARVGVVPLAGVALLALAWWWLATLSVQMGGFKAQLTLWQLLGLMNSSGVNLLTSLGGGGGSAGFYGFLGLVGLAGPIVASLVADRRAQLGHALPLLFLVVVGVAFYAGVQSGVEQAQSAMRGFGGAAAARQFDQIGQQVMREAMQAISLGMGAYLGLLVSLALALRGGFLFLTGPRG